MPSGFAEDGGWAFCLVLALLSGFEEASLDGVVGCVLGLVPDVGPEAAPALGPDLARAFATGPAVGRARRPGFAAVRGLPRELALEVDLGLFFI